MDDPDAVLDRLTAAVRSVTSLTDLPSSDGRFDWPAEAAELLAAAEAASSAELAATAENILIDADVAEGSPAMTLVVLGLLRLRDREFIDHGVPGLVIERVDFASLPVSVSGIDMRLEATLDGGFRPVPMRADERAFANVSTEIQVLLPNDDEHAARVARRELDPSGLHVSNAVEFAYEQRLSRRVLWGFGQCVLTDQRLLGVMFQRDDTTKPRSVERTAMPEADLFGSLEGPSGSVVGFSMDRTLFREHALLVPVLGRRIPDVVLTGEIDVALSTMGAEDAGGTIGKAAKGQIAGAVERFWTSS